MRTLQLAGVMIVMAFCCLVTGLASRAATTATVVVKTGSGLGQIPATAYGINTAVWDGLLTDPSVPGLLDAVGTGALRYPGGSTSDVYHWQTNTQTGGGYCFPQDSFDSFMTNVAIPTGASPIITVNYGSNIAGTGGGQPSEAAAWVNYANNVQHYGIKYWEIGNEVYGNGEYDNVKWEEDLHPDHSPTEYGRNVNLYIDAMKTVDPTIKIGAVLAAPGGWPDGVAPDWNSNVLAECGKRIDFVIVHWYAQNPGSESDSALLGDTSQIAGMVAATKALIKQYCGYRARQVQIFVTETNSVSSNPGRQSTSLVNALFLDDDTMDWLENGVVNVDWWALHNGASAGNVSSNLYGTLFYGDYGILADSGLPEPGPETPFPAYEAKLMLADFALPGDTMVSSVSNNPLLACHAVKRADGDLSLLLINKDPVNTCAATVNVRGYVPGGLSRAYFYGEGSTAVTQSAVRAGVNFRTPLPPYSLTTIDMAPSAITSPVFVASAAAAPAFTVAGGLFTILAQVTDKGAAYTGATIEFDLKDSTGALIAQKQLTGVAFSTGTTRTYKLAWTAPPASGPYSVEVDVVSADGTQQLYTNPSAAQVTVNAADIAQYGFETGTDGWLSSGGMISSFEPSTAQAFAGLSSLEVDFAATAADTQQVYVTAPATPAGSTITFEVWIPADTTIAWVQPFAQEGAAANYQWLGDWQPISNLQGNAWNTFTVAVPANAAVPLLNLGVQFYASAPWTGTCYVDSVSW